MIDILFELVSGILPLTHAHQQALQRLGIINLRDLLFYRPNSYQVRDINPSLAKLRDGQVIQTEVKIHSIEFSANKRRSIKIVAANDTGAVLLVFFNPIPPFILNKLKIGSKHVVSGKVQFFDYYFQIIHPQFLFNKENLLPIEPIYPLTFALINKQLHSYILQGLKVFERAVKNTQAFKENGFATYLTELLEDLKVLHLSNFSLPVENINQAWNKAIKRLAEKELRANQASLARIRQQRNSNQGKSFKNLNKSVQDKILVKLNFKLTTSQVQVLEEIEKDQASSQQMMRLLQGDVGSGKTLVALLTAINVVQSDSQVALMAPTDVLARQHYDFFSHSLQDTDIKIGLLTGKTTASEKKKILENLQAGTLDILIGTHALFQQKVLFKDLGYIIIDEQHKFGVEQRLGLITKGSGADVLIMTATPIPRSLTLAMFGDMSISLLTTKPKNRLPIITAAMSLNKIDEVLAVLHKKINNGEKIYWICPLIEHLEKEPESQEDEALASDVCSRTATLREIYASKVDMLHSRMSNEQKEDLMQRFKSGEIQILVATTVVEVGIDIPDATLIIIENTERFGLSQLHQLRGRVGRGYLQSHCILLYNPKKLSNIAYQRISILKNSNDGFHIAEQDLILRGSGEIIGTKQSGEPLFYFADLTRDNDILIEVNEAMQILTYNKFWEWEIKLFSRNHLFPTNKAIIN